MAITKRRAKKPAATRIYLRVVRGGVGSSTARMPDATPPMVALAAKLLEVMSTTPRGRHTMFRETEDSKKTIKICEASIEQVNRSGSLVFVPTKNGLDITTCLHCKAMNLLRP